MLKNIEAIIYDLDGVLVDSSQAICKSFNEVLAEFGEKGIPEHKIKEMIGIPLQDIFRRVFPQEKHNLIKCFVTRYIELFKQTAVNQTHLLDGVKDTVAFFKAEGLKQSVATTKTAEETDLILKGLNIREYFDLVLGFTNVTNPKPDPEIIIVTLKRLDVAKDHAVMIGDTTLDIESGKKAGVHTIAVTTGTHSKGTLTTANPDYLVNSIRDLKRIVIVDTVK